MEPMKQKTDDARKGITDGVTFWRAWIRSFWEQRWKDPHWGRCAPLPPLKQRKGRSAWRQFEVKSIEVDRSQVRWSQSTS